MNILPIDSRPDKDLQWALEYVRDDADVCSAVNGSDSEATKEARRLETVLYRLAREAGYILEAQG